MLARDVSDLTGPSSGAYFTSCVRRLVCGNTVRTIRHGQPLLRRVVRVLPHTNLRIQLVKYAPEDGPVRSETCRANICDE